MVLIVERYRSHLVVLESVHLLRPLLAAVQIHQLRSELWGLGSEGQQQVGASGVQEDVVDLQAGNVLVQLDFWRGTGGESTDDPKEAPLWTLTIVLVHIVEVHPVDRIVGHYQHQLVVADGHVADVVGEPEAHVLFLENRILGLSHRNVARVLDRTPHGRGIRIRRRLAGGLGVELVQEGRHRAWGEDTNRRCKK